MSPAPSASRTLFDLGSVGPVTGGLLIVLLGLGIAFMILSFTSRYGRSRWPFHALLATSIVSIGLGLMYGTRLYQILILLSLGGVDPGWSANNIAQVFAGQVWFGFIGVILGGLAGIRAVFGIIREPGPRF